MIAVGKVGAGLTGCMRYVLSEGRDPKTNAYHPAAANDDASRVAWISGQGLGDWKPSSRDDAETMRQIMEHMALNQSTKRKCEKDCLHLILSWRVGENPSRAEMEQAAREALAAIGMEKARAVFVAHRDTDHAHLHIVASRIDPETGRTFSDSFTKLKWQRWAHDWELRHGLVQCPKREKRSQLQAAIEELNAAAVIDLLTQKRATFTGKELDRALAEHIKEAGEAAAFRAEILAHAEIIPLYARDSGKELDRYTTRTIRDSEAGAIEHAAALATDRRHQVSDEAKAVALATRRTMREEQRRAFDHATGAEGLAIIDGKAGTGKSYTMNAIRAAYEAEGVRVIGLAPTNAVAQDMKRDGYADARTIHSALFALNNERDQWNEKTVVMVDEAAMVGTRLMSELLSRAREAGAKLILVGDDRQLASIERGGLFTELRQRFGAAELSEVTRQRDDDHKAAAEMLARGEFVKAVDALEKLDCIKRSNHQTEARAALVEQWAADTAAAPDKARFVFAYTNDDVHQLNAELRAVRKSRGELGDDHAFTTKDGSRNFAEGDRLIFTETDKRKGIINGAVGTIERIEGQSITLKMDGENGQPLTVNAEEFDAFRHAYAGTIYKGQGRTFDEVYLYHSQHWKDSDTYVALTRHRDDVKLFVSTEVAYDNTELARQMARHEDNSASLAYATQQEAEQIRQERHQQRSVELQRTAQEVTGHKAAPVNEPLPPTPEPEQPTPTYEPERPELTVTPIGGKDAAATRGEEGQRPPEEVKAEPQRPEERKAAEAREQQEALKATHEPEQAPENQQEVKQTRHEPLSPEPEPEQPKPTREPERLAARSFRQLRQTATEKLAETVHELEKDWKQEEAAHKAEEARQRAEAERCGDHKKRYDHTVSAKPQPVSATVPQSAEARIRALMNKNNNAPAPAPQQQREAEARIRSLMGRSQQNAPDARPNQKPAQTIANRSHSDVSIVAGASGAAGSALARLADGVVKLGEAIFDMFDPTPQKTYTPQEEEAIKAENIKAQARAEEEAQRADKFSKQERQKTSEARIRELMARHPRNNETRVQVGAQYDEQTYQGPRKEFQGPDDGPRRNIKR